MRMGYTLVIGGAASGKSAFAEGLVVGDARIYIATSRILDAEMDAKRARHIEQRGPGWRTVEEPLDLAPVLAGLAPGAAALLDCATMWLTNQMMAERDLERESAALVAALVSSKGDITVVTNELGHGIVPADAMTRAFRDAQGRLNIALAAKAERVCLVTAGLPLWLKGAP